MTPSQGYYNCLKRYEIPINGRQYGFWTLVSQDGAIAWMPDNEQQHVNPQHGGGTNSHPVLVDSVNKWDVGRIVGQILLFQTKNQIPLEDIVSKYVPLVTQILNDFQSYQLPKLKR